jgi:predicted outer membrane repeat protein
MKNVSCRLSCGLIGEKSRQLAGGATAQHAQPRGSTRCCGPPQWRRRNGSLSGRKQREAMRRASAAVLAWSATLLAGNRAVLGFDTLCVGGNSASHACTPDRPISIQNALGGTQPGDTVLVFPGEYTGGINDDTTDTGAGRYAWWSSASPTQAQPTTAEEDVRNVNLRLSKLRSHVTLKSLSGPSQTIISCEKLDSGLPLQAVTHRVVTGCTSATRCPGSPVTNDCSNEPDCAVRGNCALGCVITTTAAPDRIMDGFGIVAENGETYQTLIEGFTITKCGRVRDGRPGGGLRILGGTSSRNFPEMCSAINPTNAQHATICTNVDLSGLDPEVDKAGCENASGGNICEYYYGAGVTVRNTWFVKNYGSQGAAIAISQQGHVVLERVVLRENVAETNGGAIYADVGNFDSLVTNLIISDALIVGNVAGQRGGGLATNLNVASCNIHISNSVIATNTAGQTGGGLDDQFTTGEFRMWNTVVANNVATVQSASSQMFCGPNVNIVSDQPDDTCQVVDPVSGLCAAWLACVKGTGRGVPLQLSTYSSELAPTASDGMNSLVVGVDKMSASLETKAPVQGQLPFFYGVPGQVWYLPPPAMESCTGPVAACSTVTRSVPSVPFTESQCTSAHPTCVYAPNQFRDPVTLTVSGMTLRPFRDMVEVLLIPKTTDSLEDIFDVECYTRSDGSDYRGLQSVSRSGISCVAWDAHSPTEHYERNTPALNPFDGLEDGPYCRNPDRQPAPWCYLAEATSSNREVEACGIGQPVGACARDLDVMAKFTSNSTWEIFADYDKGMFIKLNLDEDYMTEGGLTLALEYADSCTSAGCSGHGVCQEPEAGAPHVCICDDGYLGVDCAITSVFYTRVYGSNGRSQTSSAINVQTALTLSDANDVVRINAGTYSGDGNYDIVLGNVNVTFAGAGPLETIIDCQSRGRGFYIDSSVATGSVSVAIESLTVSNCYANDSPVRGPIGGAAFIKHTVATFRNVVLRNNRADAQGGAIYGFRSTIFLEDTVIGPGNIAPIGGGLGLESTILLVDRAFVNDNVGTSLTELDGEIAGNLNCFADSRVEYARGFHWKELGKSILELETCSCCNGCQQAVPALEVTQVTIDKEIGENATLGELSTKVILQGSFISFGDDSVATQVYVAGQKCDLRNVTSYQIICGLEAPYEEGQNISVRRSDGERAEFPTQQGTCTAVATAACAAVDATAVAGVSDCSLAGGGACAFVAAVAATPAACVAADASMCEQAFGSEEECLAAGRCVFTAGPDKFPVYPGRGVNKLIDAVAPLQAGQTSENNGRTKVTLSLKSQPQAIVEIPVTLVYAITPEALAQGVPADFIPAVVETPMVYFTSENWAEPAQVVLSGVDDRRSLPMAHDFEVRIGPTRSMDINYKDREMFLEAMVNMPFDCLKFGSFGYVPAQIADATVCVCDKGYEKDPIMLAEDMSLSRMDDEVPCVQCANGKYKAETGNQECTACPLSNPGGENFNKIDTANLMGQTSVDACVCRAGLVYDDSVTVNNTCILCDELCWDKLATKKNLKNFDVKKPDTWCIECDNPGVRLSTMTVREGWWRNARNSTHVYQCPSTTIAGATAHCLEHDGVSTNASTTDSCVLGSHGVMCTGCDASWAKVYNAKGGCLDCSGAGQVALMTSALLLLVGFMFATVYLSIKSADDEDRTSTMLLKIMISFTVTNIEVMKYRSQWPTTVSTIFNYQKEVNSKTSFSMSDITSFDCWFAGQPTEERIWTKLVFYLLLPLASLVLPAMGAGPRWLFLRIKVRGMHPKAPEYLAAMSGMETCKEWFLAGIIVILYQVYPSTVNTAASIFNCKEYQFDEALHLTSEETVRCDGEKYEYWKRVAWAGLLGFGLGVPVLLGFVLKSLIGPVLDANGKPKLVEDEDGRLVECLKMDDPSISRKYGFLYGGFRESRIWWEAIVAVRKLLFLLSATFLASFNTAFKIAVAMLITVTFMTLHLVLEPYPDDFKEVGAMECLGMLTVFFTYGAVLMMEQSLADSQRVEQADGGFTTMEWVFFWIIILVNGAFMALVFGLAVWDIWRNTHKHIQEHGLKASVGHAKQALREKTKVDQIAKVVASPRDFRRTLMSDKGSFREDSRRAVGLGMQHQLRKKKEEARNHENAKMNWLRGLSGATAAARTSRALSVSPVGGPVDRDRQNKDVTASRNAIERADRNVARRREFAKSKSRESHGGYDTEEVEELRRELTAVKQELAKTRKGNVANRLRLGLRENKILQLQMSGGRMPATAVQTPIDIDDIDEILASERVGTVNETEQAKKDIAKLKAEREKVVGVGGQKTAVRRKWEGTLDQAEDGESEPQPPPQAEPEPEPEPEHAPAPTAEQESAVDASQMVGTKIFYGNADREDAGRNAKQFLRAVQEVKNQGRKNSQLSDVIGKALQKDHSWFTQTTSDVGVKPTPPPTGVPNAARSTSHASAIFAAGRQSSAMQGTLGVQGDNAGPGLDLEAVEAGLGIGTQPGDVTPLSTGEIDDQVEVWQRANRDAEVHALKTKMLMLGRFSAATLASTQPRSVQPASPDA